MSNDNHTRTFTAVDIEKYHKGLLSPKEMHAMEKAALDDPFLADALEGYAAAGVNAEADIAELKKRLDEKAEAARVIPIYGSKSSFPWLRAAVLILFIAGAGLLSYVLLFDKNNGPSNVAQTNEKDKKDDTINTASTKPAAETEPDTVISINPGIGAFSKNQQGTIAFDSGSVKIKTSADWRATEKTNNDGVTHKFDEVVASGDLANNNKPVEKNNISIGVDPVAKKTTQPNAAAPNRLPIKDNSIADSVALYRGNAFYKTDIPVAAAEEMKNFVLLDNERKQKAESVRLRGVASGRELNQGIMSNGYAQQMKFFRGQITDAHNNPLPFSNVTNISDNVGTYTDAKGNFTLVSTDSIMDVQIKSLGFVNSKVRLQSKLPTNQIFMREDRSVSDTVLSTAKPNYTRARDGNMAFEEPEPEEGWSSYDAYLSNNLNLPESYDSKKKATGDVVELSFEVNKDGEPVKIRIEKSLCDKCDQEAIRLVKQGPKWKRKSKKGKRTTVKVPFVKPGD